MPSGNEGTDGRGVTEELLESYRSFLRAIAHDSMDAALRSKLDSTDLVQEALTKACEHFGQFRGQSEAELAGWLRGILRNHLNDVLRSYSRAKRETSLEVSLEDVLLRAPQAEDPLAASDNPCPDELVARHELLQVVTGALQSLEPDARDVILLRSLQELDWGEVGKRLGRTPDASRMLWQRAIKRLRSSLPTKLG